MLLPEHKYIKPESLEECLTALRDAGESGQIDGQVFSGMGQTLYEECETDDGQFLNPSRLEYKMPRTYEMPEVEYIIVETIDPCGPFGVKEVGEGAIVVTVGAIAAAVGNAVGEFMPDMPMTPWKVLHVIRQREIAEQRSAYLRSSSPAA